MEGHDLKAREGQLEAKQQLREASDVNQNYAQNIYAKQVILWG